MGLFLYQGLLQLLADFYVLLAFFLDLLLQEF